MNGYSAGVCETARPKGIQPMPNRLIAFFCTSIPGHSSWYCIPVALGVVFFHLVGISGATPLSREEPVILVRPHGWDGASLPFDFHEDRLTLWHCRATCGTLDILRMRAIALVDGHQQTLAEISGPTAAGGEGTLYVVSSERAKRESTSQEGVLAIGFSFEGIKRNTPAIASDALGNQQMVSFIAPRQDFRCGVSEERMLCVFLFGRAGEGTDEQKRVSDAAVEGDLVKLLDSAKACDQTSVVVVLIAAE